MTTYVNIAKRSGHLCLLIPLFSEEISDNVENLGDYRVVLTNNEPRGYLCDYGFHDIPFFNKQFVEQEFEILERFT